MNIPQTVLTAIAALILAIGIQTTRAPAQSRQPIPTPNHHEVKMLVLSTVSAVNHANLTGNYSVLHALATPNFQRINPPHRLAAIFQNQRRAGIDIAPALLYEPHLVAQPQIDATGQMRIAGNLPTRPIQIDFDLSFQRAANRWLLSGISITPHTVSEVAPAQSPKQRPLSRRLSQMLSNMLGRS